jgi:hypothetical protein
MVLSPGLIPGWKGFFYVRGLGTCSTWKEQVEYGS